MQQKQEYIDLDKYVNSIPVLSDNVIFSHFDKETYLVKHSGYQLRISNINYDLLQLINGKINLLEIGAQLSQKYNTIIHPAYLYELLFYKFADYGIIKSDKVVKKKQRAIYLKLSFIIFKQKYVSYVSGILSFLFAPKLFYSSIFAMLSFIISLFILFSNNIININEWTNPKRVIPYSLVFFVITIFHEIGHATACRKFGAKHGGIGFGFYILTPVFFADVSDAWKLKVYQRIIINLAGMYIELFFVTIFLLVFLFTGFVDFFYLSIWVFIALAVNLNPLIRYDGYWVLSDAINVPNLRTQSTLRLKTFFESLFKKFSLPNFSKLDWFLLLYATISSFFIIVFVFYILFFKQDSLLYFPQDIYYFFKQIISFQKWQDWNWVMGYYLDRLILPFLFYYLAITMGVNFIVAKIKSHKNGVFKE